MNKVYFLTAPLLKVSSLIKCGDCTLSLRGQDGYSFIEGPSRDSISDALDDLICVLIESGPLELHGLRVVLRSEAEPAKYPNEPKEIKSEDWLAWAFSRIQLTRIPVVYLDNDVHKQVERTLRTPVV
jgi:hypothetical protein